MTVKVSLEFPNVEAAVAFLTAAHTPSTTAPAQAPTPIATPATNGVTALAPSAAPASVVVPIADAPKRKRGRPSRTDERTAVAIALNATAPVAAVAEPVAAAPKYEDAHAALKKIFEDEKLGGEGAPEDRMKVRMGLCETVLKRHGTDRISQLQPTRFAAFIKDCEAIRAGKDISAAA